MDCLCFVTAKQIKTKSKNKYIGFCDHPGPHMHLRACQMHFPCPKNAFGNRKRLGPSPQKKVSRAWPDGRHALRARGLPWSPIMSAMGRAGWVSRGSGPWSPMVSDYERQGLGRCHAVRVRGLPWSPIMSAMGPAVCGAGWVSRGSVCGLPWSPIVSDRGWAGVTRFGSVVSHGLR